MEVEVANLTGDMGVWEIYKIMNQTFTTPIGIG